jgi:hypothetical protein
MYKRIVHEKVKTELQTYRKLSTQDEKETSYCSKNSKRKQQVKQRIPTCSRNRKDDEHK